MDPFVAALGATIALIYAGYPALLWLATRTASLECPPSTGSWPSVRVMVPAHDEADCIVAKVRNTLAQDYPGEVGMTVISDGSTDGTDERVQMLVRSLQPDQRARVRLVRLDARCGKSLALSRVVPSEDAELLVLTDANAMLRPDAVRRLARWFGDSRVGLVSGRIDLRPSRNGSANDEGLYWRYENRLKSWEGALGRLVAANGALYAMRRALFEPVPAGVADDLANPQVVAAGGALVVFDPDAVAEEHLAGSPRETFRAKMRVVARGLEGVATYWPRVVAAGPIRVAQFVLHKLGRWLVPVLLLALLARCTFATGPLEQALLVAQLGFYSLAAVGAVCGTGRDVPRWMRVPFYFCLVNAAVLGGLLRFALRRPYSVWEKATSTR